MKTFGLVLYAYGLAFLVDILITPGNQTVMAIFDGLLIAAGARLFTGGK